MSDISIKELELQSFFGVAPSRLDQEVPWPYNEYSYRVELSHYSVEFIINPACKDISFSIRLNGEESYKFSAMEVQDVRYHKDADIETLEIVIADNDRVWLRLHPTVFVAQDVNMASGPTRQSRV